MLNLKVFSFICYVVINPTVLANSTRDPAAEQLNEYAIGARGQVLSLSNGRPIESLLESMTAGPRGPVVLKDLTLLDSLAHFDRERIPERVVHAKGGGAFGYFETTTLDASKYCKAKMFSTIGKQTPMAMRFSTVGGESGSADTARDPRGFAMKYYTEEGNWDLVGNNTPIFFIRDPMLFPSFVHTQKRNPRTHLKDRDAFWDFISLRPETTNQVTFLFGPRGTPDGFRHMDGFGSHTFKNVNEHGEAVYVKYHFLTNQGVKNLEPSKAAELEGSDPDYAIRDLYNAIENKEFPSWKAYIQVMSYDQANDAPFNPFDLTKRWPVEHYPLIEIGKIVLNRNPMNFFAEVEQLAFAPSNLIPGVEPSPDKMLQARLFAYADTQRHRLGPNNDQLPVNCPYMSKVANNQRDGLMRLGDNQGGAPNYFPNSFNGAVADDSKAWHIDELPTGDIKRYDTGDDDNFSQAGDYYRNDLSDAEREQLTDNIAGHLIGAQKFIRDRAIENFRKADADYGQKVCDKVAALEAKMTA